jgi:2-C-methyl-D-erythritol 4-phosphate cytidylyltransferase
MNWARQLGSRNECAFLAAVDTFATADQNLGRSQTVFLSGVGAMSQGRFAVILPAAGKSSRFGDPKQKKIYAELDGRAVWLRSVEPFVNREDVAQIIMAIAAEDREMFERRYRASVAFMNIKVIEGGAERSDTVARALEFVDPQCDHIAVHDAARPCLSTELVDAVFQAAVLTGAALLAVRVSDTIKRAGDDRVTTATVPRDQLYLAQTPQVFRRDLLEKAYAQRSHAPGSVTDDCQLVEALGHGCTIVDGSPLNLKITTHVDLKIAAAILPLLQTPRRAGPAHAYADDQAMWGDLPKLTASDLFGS